MPPRNRQRPGTSMLAPQPEALTRGQSGPAERPAAEAAASGTTMKFLSARVPKELRDELHHQAIREGRPVAQLVEDSVRLYLEQNAPT